jgi:hypothetical protein
LNISIYDLPWDSNSIPNYILPNHYIFQSVQRFKREKVTGRVTFVFTVLVWSLDMEIRIDS